jgi:hypothetical protein
VRRINKEIKRIKCIYIFIFNKITEHLYNNFSKIIIMNNIYFYLLLGVFFYFVINRFIENYIQQENFDPSLVPVSSIVTLAKVAQKLVNGNGTLTNPGSLQIGASTATPGNLTVTGNSTVNGNINVNAGPGNNGININSGNPFLAFNKSGATAPQPQIYNDGTTLHAYNAPFQVDQNLTVGGDSKVIGGLTAGGITAGGIKINGALQINNQAGKGLPVPANNLFDIYGYGDGLHFGWSGFNAMTLDNNAKLTVRGNISADGMTTTKGLVSNSNDGSATWNFKTNTDQLFNQYANLGPIRIP